MNLIQKGHGHSHRGVIGIESAIVLIAFVIVAAALAFVVLNMGFATSQKAKTSIIASLQEAGSSLVVSGKVTGHSATGGSPLTALMVPLKLTSGGESIDLDDSRATVSYISDTAEYDNILRTGCTSVGGPYANASIAWADGAGGGACAGAVDPFAGVPGTTRAMVYWAVANGAVDSILEQGEHAVLAISFKRDAPPIDAPDSLDKIKLELTVAQGATLTVERQIPNISTSIVDLG